MKDRVPSFPGRVKLTPVSGQANTYDMVRADSPTQEGTPLNKDTLLKDTTATALGLTGDPTVDDALAKLRELAATSEYKAGDVMVTTRQNLSDEWVLCNGAPASAEEYPALSDYIDSRLDMALMSTWPGTAPPSELRVYSYGTLKYLNGWYLWPYRTDTHVRILYKKNWGDAWLSTGDIVAQTSLTDIYYVGGYYVLTHENIGIATYMVYSTDFRTGYSGTVPAPYGTLGYVGGLAQVGDALYAVTSTVSATTVSLQLWKMQASRIASGFTVVQTISLSTGGTYNSAYTSTSAWYFNSTIGKYFCMYGAGGSAGYDVSLYVLDPESDTISAETVVQEVTTTPAAFWDAADAVVAKGNSNNSFKWFSKNATTWDAWIPFTPPTTNFSLIAKIKNKYVFTGVGDKFYAYVTGTFGGESTTYTADYYSNYANRLWVADDIIFAASLEIYSGTNAWGSNTKFYVFRNPDVGFEKITPIVNMTSLYGTSVGGGAVNGILYLRAQTANVSSGYPVLYYVQSTLPTITFDGAYAYIKVKEETA